MTSSVPSFTQPHPFPGKLIIVEGIDGSGKSTQLMLLKKWLEAQDFHVSFTEWNSSALVRETTRRGKKTKSLTPTTFSLLHATDFASRLYHQILPPLKAGMLVLADRYVYTAFTRDAVRGVARDWVRNVYNFAVRPDLAFYFRVPIDTAIQRLLTGTRAQLKYYEAGMDLRISPDLTESFRIFQSRILGEYEKVVEEYGLVTLDATQPIHDQQDAMRAVVTDLLNNYRPKRGTYGKRTQIFWRRFTLPNSP